VIPPDFAVAACAVFGYNSTLVLRGAFHLRKSRAGQIQHAPGRFHSGAQVVKETEQATVAPCGRGVAANPGPCPASAAGFRFNIKEIRND